MTLKRLYSGNIGKKNIFRSVVYENTSNKSSWERISWYPKSEKSEKKMVSYYLI